MIGAVAVAAAFVGFGALSARDGGEETASTTTTTSIVREAIEREGSEEIEDAAPVDVTDSASAYRITYRVAIGGSSELVEEVTVRRPFTGETKTSDGGGNVTGLERLAFGRVITAAHEPEPIVFAVGPEPVKMDLRLAPALDEAIDRGWLERREVREVAGRRCQVFRAATTVAGGSLTPPGDHGDEYADVCVDASGLLLEEVWVLDGELLRHRVAVEVGEDVPASFGEGWTELPVSMGVEQGGGSVRRLQPGSAPPGTFFEARTVPDGFQHLGRFTVVPPQANAFGEGGDRYSVVASTADVWQRGVDVLVVDQGGTLGGNAVYERDPENRTVDVPGLGEVELVVSLTGNEVRLHRDVGRYVRVLGTLTHDELLDVARSLEETEGTGLVIDDGPLLRPS